MAYPNSSDPYPILLPSDDVSAASGNGGIAVPAPAPPAVLANGPSASVNWTAVTPPNAIKVTTYINPVTTLKAIYTLFRISDANLNNLPG